MAASRRHARILVVALAAGALFALAGIRQAHALAAGPAGGAKVDYVLGRGSEIAAIRVSVARPARTVSVRLGGGRWISCRVRGLAATCPLPPGAVRAEDLTEISVAATT